MITSKICSLCNKDLKLTLFSKQKKGKYGRRSSCKECIRISNGGLTNAKLLKRKCTHCTIPLNSLTPYKKYCNDTCKQKECRLNFPSRNYLTNKRWKDDNKDHINAQSRLKYQEDPGKYIAKTRKRQATKLNATFSGLDSEIEAIYKSCPAGSEVHHIIPLQEFSDFVCGLHVPWNLVILTKDEHVEAHRLLKSDLYRL